MRKHLFHRRVSPFTKAKHAADWVVRALGISLLAGVGWIALTMLPDVPHYLRIRSM